MRLLIAIPVYDYMHFQFVECLTRLLRRLDADGIDYEVAYQGGTLVYVGRDKLAKRAINQGFTHMLWLDADITFSDEILDALLFCGKPFVSGIYHGRREPHASCIFKQIFPEIDRWQRCDYPASAFKIAGCGFGCVLISTEIIKAVFDKNGTAFFPMRELGEDLAFCKRVADCGYEIWAEPSIQLGHIGHIVVYPEYQNIFADSLMR